MISNNIAILSTFPRFQLIHQIGHGGSGGQNGTAGGGVAYGAALTPNFAGSPGCTSGANTGGGGGGVVLITASLSLSILGNVTANGVSGQNGGGGGSGGSIWIRTASITGSGVISAVGGPGLVGVLTGGGGAGKSFFFLAHFH